MELISNGSERFRVGVRPRVAEECLAICRVNWMLSTTWPSPWPDRASEFREAAARGV
jgi:hypothetical protein